jgi:hypothetical protein
VSDATTTAEVTNVISFSKGSMFGFTVYTDRKQGRSGLTKGRKLGMLVDTTLPNLLRGVADLIEQNGGTWDGLIEVLERVPE